MRIRRVLAVSGIAAALAAAGSFMAPASADPVPPIHEFMTCDISEDWVAYDEDGNIEPARNPTNPYIVTCYY